MSTITTWGELIANCWRILWATLMMIYAYSYLLIGAFFLFVYLREKITSARQRRPPNPRAAKR